MTESRIKFAFSLSLSLSLSFCFLSSTFLVDGRKPRNNAQTFTADEILWKNISYASMEHLERADAFLFRTLYFRPL